MATTGASRACPNCNSRRFKFAPLEETSSPQSGPFDMRDRICKDCGTRYSPPMPQWAPYLIPVTGVLIALIGVVGIFDPLMKGFWQLKMWVPFAMVLLGLATAVAGILKIPRRK